MTTESANEYMAKLITERNRWEEIAIAHETLLIELATSKHGRPCPDGCWRKLRWNGRRWVFRYQDQSDA